MRPSLFFSGLCLLGAATAARAADLPSVRFAPAPPPIFASPSWTGFYVGASVGGAWTKPKLETTVYSHSMAALPGVIETTDSHGSGPIDQSGLVAGLHAGYDAQFGRFFVAGLEADFSLSSLSGSRASSGIMPVFNGPFVFQQRASMDWLVTTRARLGVLATDSFLVYATGGAAFARLRATSEFADSFDEFESWSGSTVRTGWTVGGGVEYRLADNWSVKAEYLHAEFGGLRGVGYAPLTDATVAIVEHQFRRKAVDIARLGINYRFGGR